MFAPFTSVNRTLAREAGDGSRLTDALCDVFRDSPVPSRSS